MAITETAPPVPRRADRAGKQSEVKIPPRHARHRRQRLPVEVILQDRCLSLRGPGAAAMGPLAQSALVDENDRPPLVLDFFLSPASASASTRGSSPRPAPERVRWAVGNSSPTAAGCATPGWGDTSPRI